MQENLFDKNINALKDKRLKEKLQNFNERKFQVQIGDDSLDINFIKENYGGGYNKIYDNALFDLHEKIKTYDDKYFLYPVLYFYGFGNGILYKVLLQNKHRQKIVVFEQELEFIFLSFHYIDFSEELKTNSLIIFDTNAININDFEKICSQSPFFNFLRVYFLDLHCDYYEKYQNDILKINRQMQEHIKKVIYKFGNDSEDSLIGIQNFIHNIQNIVSCITFKELLKKRSNTGKNAIIVSTGPSLIKQLALLKQYSNKATIFCADSAYPILAKYNIKPDYVLSLERVDFTSEFFNNDFGEFDKDIVFVLKSLTHPNTFKYLEKKQVNITTISMYSSFFKQINLNKFGYMDMGQSVAVMAYMLAMHLKYQNIILIGQDLAYANDGASHPEEYHYGKYDTYDPKDIDYNLKTTAYGAKGEVKTTTTWNLFKIQLEEAIFNAKQLCNITTYNATEGGARIEGTIEKPFKELCENILDKNFEKSFKNLEKLNHKRQIELKLKAFYNIYEIIKFCQDLEKKCINVHNHISFLSSDEQNFKILIKKLDEFKAIIEKTPIIPIITLSVDIQFDLNLARIFVLNPKTKEDSFNKTLLWIQEHLEWITMLEEHTKALRKTLEHSSLFLEENLKQHNLHKQIQKIKSTKLKQRIFTFKPMNFI
ncbi:motility associated factor glycosyltransferase family protein [Campylobacter insulaenigrae]|uniref:motility associated factor glycosyltransferase family protein n=1 Tax=Campylobacter insulaenigrae TaxID=260714 RepID=UPI0021536B2B|nr:motility associated factor glycosyltransferase family protein [Campylobacter insulaenigrae]MCR6585208.1 motility associated factor glycosyltransferase family protein [Campylobacter insulaenigrae]